MAQQKGGGRRLLLPAVLVLAAVLFLFRPAGGDVEPTPALTPDLYENGQAQMDPARLAEGVVSFRYTGGEEKRVKVQVTRAGGRDYNYDLANDGSWETYSLTDGEGDYTLRVLTQKENGRYTPVYTLEYALTLADPKAPFLASTQFVRYEGTGAAALAEELTEEAQSDGEVIGILFDHVAGSLTYDETQAETVERGYVPHVDEVLERGEGICVDYATLLCAMARSRGIPCKLVMGDAGGSYHAWVEVWSGDGGTVADIPLKEGGWTLLDPTFLSGEPSEEVREFVREPGNYQVKYVY